MHVSIQSSYSDINGSYAYQTGKCLKSEAEVTQIVACMTREKLPGRACFKLNSNYRSSHHETVMIPMDYLNHLKLKLQHIETPTVSNIGSQ